MPPFFPVGWRVGSPVGALRPTHFKPRISNRTNRPTPSHATPPPARWDGSPTPHQVTEAGGPSPWCGLLGGWVAADRCPRVPPTVSAARPTRARQSVVGRSRRASRSSPSAVAIHDPTPPSISTCVRASVRSGAFPLPPSLPGRPATRPPPCPIIDRIRHTPPLSACTPARLLRTRKAAGLYRGLPVWWLLGGGIRFGGRGASRCLGVTRHFRGGRVGGTAGDWATAVRCVRSPAVTPAWSRPPICWATLPLLATPPLSLRRCQPTRRPPPVQRALRFIAVTSSWLPPRQPPATLGAPP